MKKDWKFWLYKNIPLCGLLINRYALRESLDSFHSFFLSDEPEGLSGFFPLKGDFYGKRFTDYKAYVSKGPENISIDSSKIINLYEIINICRKNNIKLTLVFSPIYYGFFNNIVNRDYIINTFKKAGIENNVLFLDYSQNELCNYEKNFFDLDHLNSNGADEFSKLLVKDLSNEFNLK